MWRIKNKTAFSLIELLVVVSIVGILGLAVMSTFSVGLKAYDRVKNYSGPQAEVLLSLDEIEKDLKNTFPWSGIDFQGDNGSVSFAGLSRQNKLERIAYFFDPQAKILRKDEQPYPQALTEPTIGGEVLASVKNISFSYCYFNVETQRYDWKGAWVKGSGTPRAIKIRAAYKGEHEDIEVDRLVLIPSAG